MRRTVLTLGFLAVSATSPSAQIVPPAPGVEIPPEVIQSVHERGSRAFQFQNAWIEKTKQIREARERFVESRGFYQRDLVPAVDRRRLTVSGNFAVPVFCAKYSDTGADPFPVSTLQTRLFDGPFVPRTLSEFYSEISYGDLNMTGTVYGWTALPNNNAFYTGNGTCNGLCGTSNVDDFILTTLGANDGAVDFGQYDNDGPDGLPNSGDDDGFVDFVAFVHPEQGAECGVNGNIWSHRYNLTNLAGAPYTTNDPRTGGGTNIRVNDYVIQPAWNCGGLTVIDIGVFCHEFGHAFGLPDLYDTNGGSQGIGHWCLMAAGNWNQPPNPAHMSAWSKDQLGWADIVAVDGKTADYDLYNVENNRTVYRLDVVHERWRRMSDCKIAGSYSMRCGLLAAEAAARNWPGGSGYGNGWDETVSRDFTYDGVGAVSLSYKFSYNLEPTYDFAYGNVTVNGITSTFATYDGAASGTENIDLTPYLGGGPTTYTVSFRVTSDVLYSDEDNDYPTACGAFVLDDVSVIGGGENHVTGFETREDGWAEDLPPNEYFLVENRQPLGSDVNVAGGGGLAIWHIETSVTNTGQFGNTGGNTNIRPRGVALEQADGLLQMEGNINRGDAGDPWPGSTNKTLFNGASTPNSNGYNGPSTASVQLLTGNGDPITATLAGGWPAPALALWAPNTGVSGNVVQIQIDGSGFARGGTAELVLGVTTIPANSVYWAGKDRVLAEFDLTGAVNGFYDLVVFNPGGSCTVQAGAFEVTGAPTGAGDAPSQFVLRPNYPNPFNPTTTIRFDVASRSAVTLRVYDVSGALVRTLVEGDRAAGSYTVDWDGRNDLGNPASSGVYFYRLTAGAFTDVRKMTLIK